MIRRITRHRALLMFLLFSAVFICALLVIRPINTLDYFTFTHGVLAVLRGQSPYTVPGYYSPPWSIIFLTPFTFLPINAWLALDIALFVTMVVDLGQPSGALLLLTPAFLTLIASANAEWLFIGPGLWLLYRAPKGWLRGVAWLLLTCKPQAVFVLLIFDGWQAIKMRDWKAIVVAAVVAIPSLALYPQFFHQITVPLDWSISVLARYGVIGAIAVTVVILILRRRGLSDYRTLGIQLSPVWTPYLLQYSFVATAFTMRKAGLLRNLVYVTACIVLAGLFWQGYHIAEHVGALGMLLLAAWLAPVDTPAVKPVASVAVQPAL